MSGAVTSPPDSKIGRIRAQAAEHLDRLEQDGVLGLALPVDGAGERIGASEADGSDGEPSMETRWHGSAGPDAAAEPDEGALPRVPQEQVPGAPSEPRQAPIIDMGDHGQVDLFGEAPGAAWSADETLGDVEAEALECVACRLHQGRNKVVFGVGNPNARLLFIGEGPGRDEDIQGEPFVGRAGKLLTRIIEAMGYRREDVYIANVVKCRPPENRNPHADEAEACMHFLMRQIAVIRPEIIVLLGRVAVQAVLGSTAPMSRLRGSFQNWRGVRVMCTYHPAYLLRNPNAKKDVWQDMQVVMEALAAESRG